MVCKHYRLSSMQVTNRFDRVIPRQGQIQMYTYILVGKSNRTTCRRNDWLIEFPTCKLDLSMATLDTKTMYNVSLPLDDIL